MYDREMTLYVVNRMCEIQINILNENSIDLDDLFCMNGIIQMYDVIRNNLSKEEKYMFDNIIKPNFISFTQKVQLMYDTPNGNLN